LWFYLVNTEVPTILEPSRLNALSQPEHHVMSTSCVDVLIQCRTGWLWLRCGHCSGQRSTEAGRIQGESDTLRTWERVANGCWQSWLDILVARHIKSTDELFDSRPTPRTESLVASAVQWAERIMRKIDNVFPDK
jgi:hypothetical protein